MSGAQTPREVIDQAIGESRYALHLARVANAFGRFDDEMFAALDETLAANLELIGLAANRLLAGGFEQLAIMSLADVAAEAKSAKSARRRTSMAVIEGGRA